MGNFYLADGTKANIAPKLTGSRYLAMESSYVPGILGVDDEDMPTIRELLHVWRNKYPRNLIRSAYYDCKERFKDFGISIPDQIKTNVQAMIGWPELAVRSLSDLSDFQGFSIPDNQDNHGVEDMFDDNELDVNAGEAIVSAYKHSCSFITVAADPEDPDRIVFTPRSADWSAGIWDRAHNRLSAALTITSDDEHGHINGFNVWLPGKVYECHGEILPWHAERYETNFDQPTVVALAYDRQMDRPFGHSRISRSLMALTDIGFRTIVRMEASAEFYAVPKLWFLGANKDAFSSDTWTSLISAINAIGYDEDGNKPEIQQIQQASMQPHSEMLKTMAMLVSSQTLLPVDYLGITLDNPSSAEAMASAERRLTRVADRQNKTFGRQLKKAMKMAVCLREGLRTPPDDLRKIHPIWAPTREVSDGARADSFSKVAPLVDGYADSDIGLARLGLSHDEIIQLRESQKASRTKRNIDLIRFGKGDSDGTEQPETASGTETGTSAPPEQGT